MENQFGPQTTEPNAKRNLVLGGIALLVLFVILIGAYMLGKAEGTASTTQLNTVISE